MNSLNLNTIYNESNSVTMKRIKDNFIDLTITSPPYNLGKKHHTGNNKFFAYDEYEDELNEEQYQLMQLVLLDDLYRITKTGGGH